MASGMAKNFKILTPKEIAAVLNRLSVQPTVTREVLEKPTPECTQVYFQHLAEFMYDLDPLQVKVQVPAVLQEIGFSSPEVYDEAVDALSVFMFSRQLAMINLIDDFTFKDIWEPNPKRVRMLMSAIINCCRYKENKLALINSMKEDLHALDSERLELVEKVDGLQRQLQTSQDQHARELHETREAEMEVQRCQADVDKLKRQKLTAERVIEEAEANLGSRKERRELQQEQTERLRQQVADLQSQVAESPEGIELEMTEMEAKVREQRANLDDLSNEKRSRLQRDQVLSRLTEHIEIVREAALRLQQNAEASHGAAERNIAAQQQQEHVRQQVDTKRAEETDLKENVKQTEQALKNAREVHEQKAQTLSQRRQQAYEQHQELQAKRNEEQKQQHILQMQRQQLEDEVANAQRAYETELHELREKQAAVLRRAEEYMHSVDMLCSKSSSTGLQSSLAPPGCAPHTSPVKAVETAAHGMLLSPPPKGAGNSARRQLQTARILAHSPSPARNVTGNPLGFMSPGVM